jgi:hypothetical protein
MCSTPPELLAQRALLERRLDSTNDDILSPTFAARPAEERKLLQRQALLMGELLDVLTARIKLLEAGDGQEG